MVAHNPNYKPSSTTPIPSTPAKKGRWAVPKDEVSRLCETDLICELADPSTSLTDLCTHCGISLEALTRWMMRPDVAERLDLMQSAAMQRARFIGNLTLPKAAQSAADIVNAYQLIPQKRTIDYAFDSGLHRANETMLKAARFLHRLTTENATQKPPPRGRGQGVGSSAKQTEPAHQLAPASEANSKASLLAGASEELEEATALPPASQTRNARDNNNGNVADVAESTPKASRTPSPNRKNSGPNPRVTRSSRAIRAIAPAANSKSLAPRTLSPHSPTPLPRSGQSPANQINPREPAPPLSRPAAHRSTPRRFPNQLPAGSDTAVPAPGP